jgi:hypothetical protein
MPSTTPLTTTYQPTTQSTHRRLQHNINTGTISHGYGTQQSPVGTTSEQHTITNNQQMQCTQSTLVLNNKQQQINNNKMATPTHTTTNLTQQ